MERRARALLAGVCVLAVAGGWGCVTKRQFRENSAAVDSRVSGVESGVEANERRIEDLRTETDTKIGAVEKQANQAQQTGNQALNKAEEAARGRLLWSVTLSDDQVKFALNRANLAPEFTAKLDELAARVKGYGKAVYLEIEGHTDSTGSEAHNMELGEMRAEAARAYLNQHGGIPLHAMSTISYGESQPIAENTTADGRARNRRVVIKVLE